MNHKAQRISINWVFNHKWNIYITFPFQGSRTITEEAGQKDWKGRSQGLKWMWSKGLCTGNDCSTQPLLVPSLVNEQLSQHCSLERGRVYKLPPRAGKLLKLWGKKSFLHWCGSWYAEYALWVYLMQEYMRSTNSS